MFYLLNFFTTLKSDSNFDFQLKPAYDEVPQLLTGCLPSLFSRSEYQYQEGPCRSSVNNVLSSRHKVNKLCLDVFLWYSIVQSLGKGRRKPAKNSKKQNQECRRGNTFKKIICRIFKGVRFLIKQ